jgi:hypothetical protein
VPRKGEGVGGGPARFSHGWKPVDPNIAAAMDRIRAARKTGPRGTSLAHTRALPSTGVGFGVTQDKLRRVDLQAEIKGKGGFTYNPRTGKVLEVGKDKGFAVAVPGTERSLGKGDMSKREFQSAVADVIMSRQTEITNGAVVGGWYSPDRDQYVVELTHILDPSKRDAAIAEGKRRNQEAIFDLATGETIPTGGFGDATPDEQAKIVTNRLLTDARQHEPKITNDLSNVTGRFGGRMEGLEFKFKSPDSLQRKLVTKSPDKGMTIDQYGNYLSDALRYTSMFPPDKYVDGTRAVLADLNARGYRIVDVQNTWKPNAPYKGVNTNVRSPDGQLFELQFHTRQSFDVKMEQHVLYEQERDPKLPPEVRAAATARMKANAASIVDPPKLTGLILVTGLIKPERSG